MDRQGFCEVETPLLWAPTPEGSREFSVPSRLHHGSFYVLPQSPQLAKQLLMVGGFDRYYQIARCLRDEDLRADRQFEFSQLDMEASFVSQDDVMEFVSEAVLDAAEAATGERPPEIARMTWAEALDRYGTDKPDLRFGMELVDLTEVFAGTEVRAFSAPRGQGDLRPRRRGRSSRSRLDALVDQAKQARRGRPGLVPGRRRRPRRDRPRFAARPLPLRRRTGGDPGSRPGRQEGDLILVVSDEHRVACTVLGTLRAHLGSPPVGRGSAPLRVGGRLPDVRRRRRRRAIPQPAHHPFTMPYRGRPRPPGHRSRPPCAPRPTTWSSTGGSWDRAACVSTAGTSSRRSSTCSGISARGGRGPLRLPARRLPLRRPAARRFRLRHRPPGGRSWPGRRTSARSSPTRRHSRGPTSSPVRRRPCPTSSLVELGIRLAEPPATT